MKQAFENILKTIPSNKQEYAIKQLQLIANKIKYLEDSNERYKHEKLGVKRTERMDMLEKCIDLLKLHGYAPSHLIGFRDKFIDFMLNNTLNLDKYKPKLINFDILNSLQQAYFMYNIEFSKEPESYFILRDFMFTWEETINDRSRKQLELLTK